VGDAVGTIIDNDAGDGKLTGKVWSATTGWVVFEQPYGTPVIDRQTGIFSGKAWSTTCGWINLGSTSAPLLQTTTKAITLPAPNARNFFRVGAPRLGP
jgi:hypothetical protein